MTCCFISRLPNDKNSNQCSQRLVMEFVLNVSSPAMFVLWFSMVQNQVVVLCSVKCWGMVWCCKVWYFTTRYLGRQGRLWCYGIWYGMVWSGMVWYGYVSRLVMVRLCPARAFITLPPARTCHLCHARAQRWFCYDQVHHQSTSPPQGHTSPPLDHNSVTTKSTIDSSATACSFSQRIIEILIHDPMLHCRV